MRKIVVFIQIFALFYAFPLTAGYIETDMLNGFDLMYDLPIEDETD